MNNTEIIRARRKQFTSQGLTTSGFKRINRLHPDLKGLYGPAYHLAYIQKQRREDREAWNQSRSEGGS